MARIRSVKPEMNTSASFNRLTDSAQIFMVKLFTECDDSGRIRWLPKKIVGNLYPLREDVDVARLETLVAELERESIFLRYSIGDERFGCFPNWDDHQKISNPGKSSIQPPSDEDLAAFRLRESGESTEDVQRLSVVPPEDQPTGTGNRDKGKGKGTGNAGARREPKSKPAAGPEEFPTEIDTPEVRTAFAEWLEHRQQIRKPVTPQAVSKLLQSWSRAGPAAFVEALNHSIANGWAGVFAPKPQDRNSHHGNGKPNRESPARRHDRDPADYASLPEIDASAPFEPAATEQAAEYRPNPAFSPAGDPALH